MARKTLNLTDALHDYLVRVSVREDEILRRLREETAELEMGAMQISPEQGQLMALLAAAIGARRALEVGVFTGYSTLSVARALPADGKIVACDVSAAWAAIGERYWREAGVSDRIDLRIAPASDTLAALRAGGEEATFDFAFIDADKTRYESYIEHALALVRPGGLVLVDNVLWGGRVADPAESDDETVAIRTVNEALRADERVDLSLVPIGDGLTVLRRRSSTPPRHVTPSTARRTVLALLTATALLPTPVHASSWTARVISSEALNDIAFPTPTQGCAVGANSTILTTTDAGQSWTQRANGGSDLRGVDFVDPLNGWAVGNDDVVMRTSDGGVTWATSLTGLGLSLQDVDFVDTTNGWAVGATAFVVNAVVATTDGGLTWTPQAVPTSGLGLLAVSFVDETQGFTVGFVGNAFRTGDGGATWVPMAVESSGDAYYTVLRTSASAGFIGGIQGTVFRTTDGGLTWAPTTPIGNAIRGLAMSGSAGFAVGSQGLVARSEDDGQNWEAEGAGTSVELRGIAAPSADSAFGVGNAGRLVEFIGTPTVPTPLNIGPLTESCTGIERDWTLPAAGVAVAAIVHDVDRDGTTDIVVGGPAGYTAFRPLVPNDEAMLWRLPFQARAQDIVIAELDGDLDTAELVVATASSGISRDGVFAMAGATGDVLWSRRLPSGARRVRAADFDEDGVDDVVVQGDGGTLFWLSGHDGADLHGARALGGVTNDLEVGDIDGDGVPDALSAVTTGHVRAFDGTTGAPLWVYDSDGGNNSGVRALAIGDVTGDGLTDVVAAGYGTPVSQVPGNGNCSSITIGGSAGALVAVLRGGDGTVQWDYAESGSDRFQAVSLADFTGDGVPDIVGHVNGIDTGHLVAMDGKGRFVGGVPTPDAETLWQHVTTSGDLQFAPRAEAIAVGDFDGDTTPDAAVGLSDGTIEVVSGVPPAEVGRCAPPATGLWGVRRAGTVYATHHVNVDGQSFILAASGADNVLTLHAPATGEVLWRLDLGGDPELVTADLDGDGRPDLGVGSVAGRVHAVAGDATPITQADSFLPAPIVGLAAADADGDGGPDLIAASQDGVVRAVHPITGATLWETPLGVEATALATGAGRVAVGTTFGDVVGLDLADGQTRWTSPGPSPIRALAFGTNPGWFVAGDEEGDGRVLDPEGGNEGGFSTGTASLSGVHALRVTDVDGNGVDEIAMVAGRAFIVHRADGSQLWREDLTTGGFDYTFTIATGDIDGDGRPDVAGQTFQGTTHAFTGEAGTSLFAVATGAIGAIAIADLDGDGRGEVIAGTPSGGFPLGTGTLTVLEADGAVLGSCVLPKSPRSLAVADVDGDGLAEVFVGTGEGDLYRISIEGPVAVEPSPVTSLTRAAPPVPSPTRGAARFAYTIGLDLAAGGPVPVSLLLFDLQGRLVRTLFSGRSDAGRHVVRWNGANARDERVAPGVYYYRFRAGDVVRTSKVVVSGG